MSHEFHARLLDDLRARLVRDYEPALAAQKGDHPPFDVVSPDVRDRLLADKLAEEAQELAQAEGEEDMILRLAAVWELVMIVAAKHRLTPQDLEDVIGMIKAEKGGFDGGFVIKEF